VNDSLGPSNPLTSDVPMEPLSTSVVKGFIWLVATTTKICTRDSSQRPYGEFSQLSPRLPTHQHITLMAQYWPMV